MSVIIKPYIGIIDYGKEINFGMTQAEVKKTLGTKPFKIEIDNIIKQTREHWSAMQFIYEKKKLIQIDFTKNVELFLNEIDLFNCDNLLEKLSEYDEPTTELKGGYINFYKLGICVGGFGKRKIPEKNLIIAFPKDRIKFFEFFIKM